MIGDDYLIWCELHPCPRCGGSGEIEDDLAIPHTCRWCDGVGLDPTAIYADAEKFEDGTRMDISRPRIMPGRSRNATGYAVRLSDYRNA